jgi:SsrA-binding protein
MSEGSKKPERKVVAENKRARHKFEVLQTFEAGLVLVGTEVKTLRAGRASIEEGYGRVDADEIWLVGAHIDEYSHGNRSNHEPRRRRKLLLRKSEIKKLKAGVTQRGFTIVPLSLWFSPRGHAKVTIALCRGKKIHDKRETLRAKEARREMRRAQ